MGSQIKYIECKSELNGRGRIGRVTFSKSGATVYYAGKSFRRIHGYKANHVDIDTGERYWISGPKGQGGDRLYGQPGVEIDEDVRAEYWTSIRNRPSCIGKATT